MVKGKHRDGETWRSGIRVQRRGFRADPCLLSSTGVARLGKSNVGGRVRRLHGPTREDAGATVDGIADFDGDLRVLWKPNVHAGAEAHEADAFAAKDGFAGLFPGDDATSDEAGNLLELDVTDGSGEREDVLFVLGGGLGVPCGEEFAGKIFYLCDGASERRAIDVDVPDGEEDADAGAQAACVFFRRDHNDATVGGGNYGIGIGRNGAVGIAEERKAEKRERDEDPSGNPPVKSEGDAAEEKRGQTEVVAFLDH